MKSGLNVLLILIVIGGLGLMGYLSLFKPVGDPQVRSIVEIPKGASLAQVAQILVDEGLIGHKQAFLWMGRLSGAERTIHPGEYEFQGGLEPRAILDKLVSGKVIQHAVTIPEGYTVLQIADMLHEKGIGNREEFLRLTRDPDMIRRLGLSVSNLEGYLFPDTYFLTRSMKPEAIVRLFVTRLQKTLTPKMKARAAEIDMSLHEVLTLASVIERETGRPEERDLISGVFHNRLRRNIPLQSDPTVIYALDMFDGDLRKRDLTVDSPYNTYRVRGLPPGPIANPGAAAIQAALYPAHTNFLYFVSRNDGSHHFSATLAEHNSAVRKYQLQHTRRAS